MPKYRNSTGSQHEDRIQSCLGACDGILRFYQYESAREVSPCFCFLVHSHSCVSYINLLRRVWGAKISQARILCDFSRFPPLLLHFLSIALNRLKTATFLLFLFLPLDADESAVSAGESSKRLFWFEVTGRQMSWLGYTASKILSPAIEQAFITVSDQQRGSCIKIGPSAELTRCVH